VANLTSLDGIEKIQNLETLRIYSNHVPITNISALQDLRNLKSFTCYDSPLGIGVFTNIGRNTSLEELYLSSPEIVDLTGVGQLRSLTTLYLSSNTSRYDSGERCTYRNLEEIGYLTGLRDLTLDETINSVEFLSGNVNLEYLILIADRERKDFYTKILPLDIIPLRNLKKLKRLRIQGFDIENYDIRHELPNLEYINTELYEYE
jgi:Leucine-rich repeat (LRR) protein